MQGKVAVITGASRGIGAAAARVFAAAGAQVALLARSTGAVEGLAAEIGPQALALGCDVADAQAVQAAVDAVVARWGRLDVLINNAGVIDPIARLTEADAAQWGHAIDINLKSVFHGIRAAVPVMRAQGGGTGHRLGAVLGCGGRGGSGGGSGQRSRSCRRRDTRPGNRRAFHR